MALWLTSGTLWAAWTSWGRPGERWAAGFTAGPATPSCEAGTGRRAPELRWL
jgi:hypothetical protein